MHFSETEENSSDDELGFVRLEFVLGLSLIRGIYLDLVVELSSFKEFEDDVKGVIRLENLVELHVILVIELSHYLDFLNQTLLSFVLAVSCFLRECLDGI